MPIDKERFIREYSSKLRDGTAALFAGAGLSMPAGFVNWKTLLTEIADDVKLSVDKEYDLIALAQYHENVHNGRAKLTETLIEHFARELKPTPNHALIARLPIRTVWTTNHDTLLEDAFGAQQKRVDVKRTPATIAASRRGADVTVYKMHGDVSLAYDAVLTKEDFETYAVKREVFTTRLKGDLVSQTFLFLGYSFNDPNIEQILARIRGLLGQHKPTHYCIMRKPQTPATVGGTAAADYQYECRKLELRVGDLQRYGIQTVLIDDYAEITEILQALTRRAFLHNVFVSGSAVGALPEFDMPRLQGFARRVGQEIIQRGFNVVSGYGWGIGSDVIVGAVEGAYGQMSSMHDRLILRPFPRSLDEARNRGLYEEWRRAMLSLTGFSIFLAGNDPDETDPDRRRFVPAQGCIDEFTIGTTAPLHSYPIPVGATGYAARQIWEQVMADLGRFYPKLDVREPFAALGDAARSDDELISAMFNVMQKVHAWRIDGPHAPSA